ncbi:MAG: tyrosine-type recombinase/integrase [Sulfuriferula sp.]
MATVSRLPSGAYRAQIRRKGLATERQTFRTEQEAKNWGMVREAELVAAQNLGSPRLVARATFSEVLEKYWESPGYLDKAPATQKRERVAAKAPVQSLGSYAISIITGHQVQAYFDARSKAQTRNGRISGHALRLEKALLSAVFTYAKRRNLVEINILRDSFELRKCESRELRITPLQQSVLLVLAETLSKKNTGNPSVFPWLTLVLETGMRPGEAAKIELNWLNLRDNRIDVPRIGQKKRSARVVMITDETATLLELQAQRAKVAGSPYIFYSTSTKNGEIVPFAYSGP